MYKIVSVSKVEFYRHLERFDMPLYSPAVAELFRATLPTDYPKTPQDCLELAVYSYSTLSPQHKSILIHDWVEFFISEKKLSKDADINYVDFKKINDFFKSCYSDTDFGKDFIDGFEFEIKKILDMKPLVLVLNLSLPKEFNSQAILSLADNFLKNRLLEITSKIQSEPIRIDSIIQKIEELISNKVVDFPESFRDTLVLFGDFLKNHPLKYILDTLKSSGLVEKEDLSHHSNRIFQMYCDTYSQRVNAVSDSLNTETLNRFDEGLLVKLNEILNDDRHHTKTLVYLGVSKFDSSGQLIQACELKIGKKFRLLCALRMIGEERHLVFDKSPDIHVLPKTHRTFDYKNSAESWFLSSSFLSEATTFTFSTRVEPQRFTLADFVSQEIEKLSGNNSKSDLPLVLETESSPHFEEHSVVLVPHISDEIFPGWKKLQLILFC